jgi:DNA-binding NtrC family response regulator
LSDDTIYPEHLPARIRFGVKPPEFLSGQSETSAAEPVRIDDWVPLAEAERDYVTNVLAHTGGNKQAAARILNIDRKTLARIVNRK